MPDRQQKLFLKPSRLLVLVLLAGHALAMISVCEISHWNWLGLLLSMALLASLVMLTRRYALLRSPNSCVALRLDGDLVELELRDGQVQIARCGSDSLISPWLTVLNLKSVPGGSTYGVPILVDGLDVDSFRQLRMHLKWAGRSKT